MQQCYATSIQYVGAVQTALPLCTKVLTQQCSAGLNKTSHQDSRQIFGGIWKCSQTSSLGRNASARSNLSSLRSLQMSHLSMRSVGCLRLSWGLRPLWSKRLYEGGGPFRQNFPAAPKVPVDKSHKVLIHPVRVQRLPSLIRLEAKSSNGPEEADFFLLRFQRKKTIPQFCRPF